MLTRRGSGRRIRTLVASSRRRHREPEEARRDPRTPQRACRRGLSFPFVHPSRTQRTVSPNRGGPTRLVRWFARPGPVVPVPLCLLSLSRVPLSVQALASTLHCRLTRIPSLPSSGFRLHSNPSKTKVACLSFLYLYLVSGPNGTGCLCLIRLA